MPVPQQGPSPLFSVAHGLGFSWGGWVTGGTARKDAATAAHDAVVVALAPICADRFRAQGDAPAKIAELAKASSWERGNVVEKSGYALMPGSKATDSSCACLCRDAGDSADSQDLTTTHRSACPSAVANAIADVGGSVRTTVARIPGMSISSCQPRVGASDGVNRRYTSWKPTSCRLFRSSNVRRSQPRQC